MIRKGDETRAAAIFSGSLIQTRQIWQNGSRVLQSKNAVPGAKYRTIVGNQKVGRAVLGAELAMLFSDYVVPDLEHSDDINNIIINNSVIIKLQNITDIKWFTV